MFVSGHLGDRVDLRYFLTGGLHFCQKAFLGSWAGCGWLCSLHSAQAAGCYDSPLSGARATGCLPAAPPRLPPTLPNAAGGMLGSGALVALFGAAYFWQVHSMAYFIAVQVMGGEQSVAILAERGMRPGAVQRAGAQGARACCAARLQACSAPVGWSPDTPSRLPLPLPAPRRPAAGHGLAQRGQRDGQLVRAVHCCAVLTQGRGAAPTLARAAVAASFSGLGGVAILRAFAFPRAAGLARASAASSWECGTRTPPWVSRRLAATCVAATTGHRLPAGRAVNPGPRPSPH